MHEPAYGPLGTEPPDTLASAEEHLRLAQEAGGVGTWEWDLHADRMRWSQQMFYNLGLEPCRGAESFEALIAALHPAERSRARVELRDFCRRAGPIRIELRIVRPDGETRSIVFLGTVAADAIGRPERVRGVTIDATNRRRGEDAVRDNAERLRLAMNAGHLAIWELDLGKRVGRWSAEAAAMHGFPSDSNEMSLTEWAALIHPNDIARCRRIFRKAVVRRADYSAEYRIVRPDGEVRWTFVQGSVVGDAGNRPARIVGVVQDISDRKEAEAASRESEERFRRVFEQSPLGKATTGPDFRFREVNPALCRMLGYTADELIGISFLDVVHGDGRQGCFELGHSLVAGNTPQVRVEERFLRKSGEAIWVNVNIGAIHDAEGRFLYSLGIFEDIEERRRIRQALQISEQRLRELNETLEQQADQRVRQLASSRAQLQAFFDNSPDWLTLQRVDAGGRFIYVDLNPACEVAYGLPRDRVVGRSVEDVLGDAEAELPVRSFRECLRTGEPQRYVAQRTMGGRTRTIDVICARVTGYAEDGAPLVITTARDISEREELEAQLRQSQKMEVVGQLTGGVAHDFNNLLTAITGNLELLEGRLGHNADTLRQIRGAQRAAERGAKLTEQLLAFSRRQHLRPQSVDANEIIDGMSDMLARTIGSHVIVRTILAGDLWPALVDPTQVEIAILNLAINARDAMPSGGEIVVETANLARESAGMPAEVVDRDCVVIAVRDSGSGMSETVLAHAIEPFFTTKQAGKGSGLGLSQVYGVARQSEGTLEIESRVGIGTTIRLYLPRAGAESGFEGGAGPAAAEAPGSGRILVVDDDPDVREIAVQMLQETGYGVTAAANGQAALEMLSGGEVYDLLLVDVVMPGLSGVETVRRAREQRPGARAVFMTGYADSAGAQDIAEGDPIVKKPFRFVELTEAVHRMLDGGVLSGPPVGGNAN